MGRIKIVKVVNKKDASNPNQEYIVLEVLENTNLEGYAILDNTYTHEKLISNKFQHYYPFPNVNVNKGDTIFLYNGIGKNIKLDKTYKFYWNSNSEIFNNTGDKIHLIHHIEIQSYTI